MHVFAMENLKQTCGEDRESLEEETGRR